MTVDTALANALAFLAYTMTLALALQVGIEQLKPLIITPLRESLKVTDENYVAFMYVVRAVLTIAAYLLLWGGVSATRAAAPYLAFVPDFALGAVTVLIVIGGEEVINALIDRLNALKKSAEAMALIEYGVVVDKPAAPTVTVDAQTAKDDYRRMDR